MLGPVGESPRTAVRRAPASSGAAERPTFESKYVFHAGYVELLKDWLFATLRPDPAFRAGCVTSLYFDTPTLDLYGQKRNSNFLKMKVRLRWYEANTTAGGTVPCYVEIKKKIGVQRTKVRVPIEFPADVLRTRLFADQSVRDAPAIADESLQGHPLVPLIVVQYERFRFIEPLTGCRIALDTAIRCPTANPAIFTGLHPVRLPVGVLETKGELRELPITLLPISGHLRREAFSKYATCCEHLMQPLGRRL